MKFEVAHDTPPSRTIKGWYYKDILYIINTHQRISYDRTIEYTCFADGGTRQVSFKEDPEGWKNQGYTPIYSDEEVKITL